MSKPILRIGTRGSPLALAQANEVRARLAAAHPDLAAPDAVAIAVIRTTGDMVRDRTLAAIGAVLEREDPRDAFFSPHARTIAALPPGAVVGTASLRRQAQVLHARPDL